MADAVRVQDTQLAEAMLGPDEQEVQHWQVREQTCMRSLPGIE